MIRMQRKEPMTQEYLKRLINRPDGLILIGLTGGIASGKSAVAGILRENHISVLSMDELAKSLYVKDSAVYQGLVNDFGPGILDDEGGIDRVKLAALVFNDPDRLRELNALVHPAVFRTTEHRLRALFDQGCRLVVLESAILFEAGIGSDMDFTVEVVAGMDIRLERAVASRGMDRKDALARIKAQAGRAEGRADYILTNNGSMAELRMETRSLIDLLKHRYIEVNRDG